jgi:hypothetical protein
MSEQGSMFTGHFVEVPPPKEAPVFPGSAEAGVLTCLRVRLREDGQWRCAQCRAMQPTGSTLVEVPDSVRLGDPSWSVEEFARTGAYNGSGSGWCVRCARKLGKPKVLDTRTLVLPPPAYTNRRSLPRETGYHPSAWRRFWSWFLGL